MLFRQATSLVSDFPKAVLPSSRPSAMPNIRVAIGLSSIDSRSAIVSREAAMNRLVPFRFSRIQIHITKQSCRHEIRGRFMAFELMITRSLSSTVQSHLDRVLRFATLPETILLP